MKFGHGSVFFLDLVTKELKESYWLLHLILYGVTSRACPNGFGFLTAIHKHMVETTFDGRVLPATLNAMHPDGGFLDEIFVVRLKNAEHPGVRQ